MSTFQNVAAELAREYAARQEQLFAARGRILELDTLADTLRHHLPADTTVAPVATVHENAVCSRLLIWSSSESVLIAIEQAGLKVASLKQRIDHMEVIGDQIVTMINIDGIDPKNYVQVYQQLAVPT